MLARNLNSLLRRSVASPSNRLVAPILTVRSFSSQEKKAFERDILEQSLVHDISNQQIQTVKNVVPWFLNSMPPSYFNQIRDELQRSHIKAVAAIHDLGVKSDLSLKIETKRGSTTEVTFISTKTTTQALIHRLSTLPTFEKSHLSQVDIFSSKDGEFSVDVFTFTPNDVVLNSTKEQAAHIYRFVDEVKAGKHSGNSNIPSFSSAFEEASLTEFVNNCSPDFISTTSPRRFMIQKNLYDKVKGSDGSAVHFENYTGSGGPANGTAAWVTVAAGNVLPDVLLRTTANILKAHGIETWRIHLDQVHDPANTIPADGDVPVQPGYVSLLRILVSPNPGVSNGSNSLFGENFVGKLTRDIKRAKWLDDSVMELGLVKCPDMGVDTAEVVFTLASMLHGPLNKTLPGVFPSVKAITNEITNNAYLTTQAIAIGQLFQDKFRPGLTETQKAENLRSIEERSQNLRKLLLKVQREGARVALLKMLDAVNSTLRTNLFFEDRYALSLRVDPRIMLTDAELSAGKEIPYGVFFSHGRSFNGFHNRFRDIARGGLRIVTPPDAEAKSAESAKHYDEVYGLSFAQQQKNKDIPEGGAKGVVQIDTPNIPKAYHEYAKRKCVKAFVDSVLDLIVPDDNFKRNVVDFFGKDEILYLGPDEQIINADIEWITNRAAQRGYILPSAFMSSKRDAGFNHKEFGVTSEGIWMFADVAIRKRLNIDPNKTPFTVKITGGPDGDVAGNLIKILFREYGSNCKVVGIADGFGVAEDPDGLDQAELLRLVNEARSIAFFDPSKLKSKGTMMKVTPGDAEALSKRNTMAFRVKADVFVPGGGRPNAINADNWRDYLDINGKPSSSLIVEGANLYNSYDARNLLHTVGVSIVKDSSANKCGVVTSSCEIQASMLLTKEEFLTNKTVLIADVLKRLRYISKQEAELLFSTFENFPGTLPHFSERISNAINRTTDAITKELESYNPGDKVYEELFPIIKDNLPESLATLAWDRVKTKFPVQYQKNFIASALASHLVYKEGIHLVELQPAEKLAQRAFMYYRIEQHINDLVKKMKSKTASNEEIEEVTRLLERGGARTALNMS